jgi:hypothetical protein
VPNRARRTRGCKQFCNSPARARSSTGQASDFGSEGWAFKSLRARQSDQSVFSRPYGSFERAFPHAKVLSLKNFDYRYRAFIDRAELERAIAEQVEAITYPNFKDEVQRVSGGARHHAYFDVWAVMRDYQNAEPL